jgi:hypothetical protein
VKVFFSMWHLGSFRMYEPVLRDLASRGHQIHLALGRAEGLGWDTALHNLLQDHPSITWSYLSPPTATFWAETAKTIRLWADYLRYFHPAYDRTPVLKARAGQHLPPRLVAISNRPRFRELGPRQRLLRLLRTLEQALPPIPEIEQELRRRRPDLVVITPLVYLGSSQFEVLRTALRLGIRTAFAVGSWDHLSSKALIRDMPHRVFVWNDTQKQEAVELHGVPSDRVVVTGAQCYDQWFGRRPSRTREEFCRRVGLPADRPLILYVCSALFWGSPIEAEFVRRWVQSLRESEHRELREAAVLIRPHPARMDEWHAIDLTPFEHVSLYGSNPVDAASKDDYFESLFYSSALVGLNTSAFLEGAIVDRPVHTVLLPEFQENQEGVLHFHYLFSVGGGVLQAGRTFGEHHEKLAQSLRDPRPHSGQQFVRDFIRPHGLERAATPVFCDAVDDLLRLPAPAAQPTPLRFVMLRWALYPALRALRLAFGAELFRDDWSRKQRAARRRRAAHQRVRAARRRHEAERKEAIATQRAAVRQAREAERRGEALARERALADKASRREQKEHRHADRLRQRRRAERHARLKQAATGWLRRLRPWHGGQTP